MYEHAPSWWNPHHFEKNHVKETVKYSAPRLEARGNELVVVRSK